MLKIAVFAALVAVALCDGMKMNFFRQHDIDWKEPEDFADLSQETGAGCCTPNQWEGIEGLIGGYAKIFRRGMSGGVARVSYDAKNQKVASVSNMTVGDRTYSFRVIQDYQAKQMYVINLQKRKCRSLPLRREFKKACIPDNAKYNGQYYLGVGSNKINAKSYEVRNERLGINAVVSVTSRGCIPLSEAIYGRIGIKSFLTTIGYVDITAGIRDPAVFTPPSICNKSDDEPVELRDSDEVSFSVFGIHVSV